MSGLSTLALLASAWLAPTSPPQETVAPPSRKLIVKGAQAKELDALLQRAVAFGYSGAVYVSKKGKPILLKGYGTADPLTGAACTPETLFDIASATKQITAAAILHLEEDGKLSREDSIAEHLPGVPKSCEDITIDHLLTHTSGFPRSAIGGEGDDLETAVRAYLASHRSAPPGEQYEYWNGGYALLAGIVQQASGQNFEDYVRDELFTPAKLLQTDFIETARVDPSFLSRTLEPGNKLTTEYIKGWGYRGMGGVLSSAADLGLWVEEVFHGGRVVSKKMRKLLVQAELQDYARGWRVGSSPTGQNFIGHGGDAPGFHTEIRYFPNEELILILLTNVDGLAYPLTGALEAALFENQAFQAPPELLDWKGDEQAAWLGDWASDGGERIRLGADGQALKLSRATPGVNALFDGSLATSFAAETALAIEIVLGLAAGDPAPLDAVLAARIPKSWPRMLIDQVIPEYVQVRGKVLGAVFAGASKASNSAVTIWLDVEHERGHWPVELQFLEGRLGRLDWETKSMPKAKKFAQVEKSKCVHFDFSYARERPELELVKAKSGQPARLILRKGSLEMTLQAVEP
jgi:CubicO group peptidase (beta-lactamase class C family)